MLSELARDNRVIVCCGAGGVGKTTTAASLGVAAARLGRRVLVLTIDPSRRLAEALGVSRNPPEPVALPRDRQTAAGIQPPGSLEAWMLDPILVTDNAVRRFAKTEESAQAILTNRLYQQGTQMVAGLHEYAAMKALHQFITEGRYDLVVLDTPPSRNALDFLDAPSRLARFLEGPVFRIFLPAERGFFAQTGARLVWRVLDTALGATFASELKVFFGVFSQLLSSLSTDLVDVRRRLSAADVAFVLVTTASPAALTEAHFFHDKIRQLDLPFGGFVVNRSRAGRGRRVFPLPSLVEDGASADLKSGLEKLKWLARAEVLEETRDRGLLAESRLARRARCVLARAAQRDGRHRGHGDVDHSRGTHSRREAQRASLGLLVRFRSTPPSVTLSFLGLCGRLRRPGGLQDRVVGLLLQIGPDALPVPLVEPFRVGFSPRHRYLQWGGKRLVDGGYHHRPPTYHHFAVWPKARGLPERRGPLLCAA